MSISGDHSNRGSKHGKAWIMNTNWFISIRCMLTRLLSHAIECTSSPGSARIGGQISRSHHWHTVQNVSKREKLSRVGRTRRSAMANTGNNTSIVALFALAKSLHIIMRLPMRLIGHCLFSVSETARNLYERRRDSGSPMACKSLRTIHLAFR